MASTGINNAQGVGLYVGGTLVAHLLGNEMNLTQELIDVTTKDSSKWKDFITGDRGMTYSCNGYVAEDAGMNFADFTAVVIAAQSTLTIRYSTEVSGDIYFEGSCYVTDLSRTASNGSAEEFSCSLTVTGTVTQGTITP